LASDTIIESHHSLRIFLAVTGDISVSTIKVTHVRAFLDAVRWHTKSGATTISGRKRLSGPNPTRLEDEMSDDKKNTGSPDRDRINVNEDYEVQYWTKALGVSAESFARR
jgi:hypothetical protein